MTARFEPVAEAHGTDEVARTAANLEPSKSRSIWILAPYPADLAAAADHLRRISGAGELDVRGNVFSRDQGEQARSEARRALREGAVALVAIVVGDLEALPATEREAWLALAQDASLAGQLGLLVPDGAAGFRVISSSATPSQTSASSANQTPAARQDAGGSDAASEVDDELYDPMRALREGPKAR